MRSKLLCLLFTVALLAAPLRSAFAAWPEKPIRMIVPSAPGGAPDILMRALCDQLAHQLGVAIIIDNKPGGSYVIGTSELVRAAPDGYTLAYGNIVSLATNRSLLASVPYDVDRDLTLVSMTWRVVNMIVVNSNLPVATVPELVAHARKSPGRLAFASDGNGTTAHLGMELFKSMTGTYMLHVPYRGAVSGLADVMAGGVQVMMANTPVVAPHVESGKLRALGITSPKRSAAYPDLPAVAESVPGFEVDGLGRNRRSGEPAH